MKLNSEQAYNLLTEAKEMFDGRYVGHSIKVGEAAARIAEKLNIDVDKAKAMGYIHDIGKRYGEPLEDHPIKGYEYMISLGYDKEYAAICLTHSYLNNDITCTAALLETPDTYKYKFKKKFIEKHEYTIYDKIINICDLICTSQFAILEERLISIMIRRGIYSNTQYHITEAVKLKKEIDEKLGVNLYSLFPEISTRISK